MVQAEGQQQTLQRTIDERCQDRGSLGRIGDPDAEVVDAGLDHRPEQRQHDGNDHRVGDDHHGHEALAVEEGQRIRQLAEVVVFIVSHTAHKTGDDAHEHAHIQRRSTQHRGEVAVDCDLLPEQGVGHGIGVFQHGAGDTEDVAGDDVDEGKCQHRRKGTACALLCPAAADGDGEQDVQVVDDGPADVLHGGADGHDGRNVTAAHLHQLAQTDHQAGSGHDGDDGHQHLAQLLQKVEVDEPLFPRSCFCCCHDVPPHSFNCAISCNHCTLVALLYATRIIQRRGFYKSFLDETIFSAFCTTCRRFLCENCREYVG